MQTLIFVSIIFSAGLYSRAYWFWLCTYFPAPALFFLSPKNSNPPGKPLCPDYKLYFDVEFA